MRIDSAQLSSIYEVKSPTKIPPAKVYKKKESFTLDQLNECSFASSDNYQSKNSYDSYISANNCSGNNLIDINLYNSIK
jgi:hypothetical protein